VIFFFKNDDGKNGFHEACISKKKDVIKFFISKGIDIDEVSANEFSGIYLTTRGLDNQRSFNNDRKKECGVCLLEAGAKFESILEYRYRLLSACFARINEIKSIIPKYEHELLKLFYDRITNVIIDFIFEKSTTQSISNLENFFYFKD